MADLQLSQISLIPSVSSAQAFEFFKIVSNWSGFKSGTNFESPKPL